MQKTPQPLPDWALVREKDLLAPRGPVPFSHSTLWRMVKAGTFPAPVKIGPRISAWRLGEARQALKSGWPPASDRQAA